MSTNPFMILFVDAEEIAHNAMRAFLADEPDFSVQAGYQVLFHTSPAKALEDLERHNVGLVIGEYFTPPGDEVTFFAEVKKKYPQVPWVLTGRADKATVLKGIDELGFYHYIEKPWENAQLAAIIRAVLKNTSPSTIVKGKTRVPTILLVDDEELVISSLRNYFRLRTDYQTLTFTSPLEALAGLGQSPVDLVIADYLMPGMDGITFLARVKDRYPQATLILLTGYADKESAVRAINELGLYYYIEKPWDWEQLELIVRNAFEKAALLQIVKEKTSALERLTELIVTKAKKANRIFLCHAKEDSDRALEIYSHLKKMGFAPWLDKQDLVPGQRWEKEIPKVIRASSFVLIFLSKTSVAKQGYVQKELRYALDVLDEMPEGRRFIIPVRLDDCEIPNRLSAFQCADLFQGSDFDIIVKSVLPD